MSPQPAGPGPGSPAGAVPYPALLAGLRRFIRTEGQHHLADPNVASIGIGPKVTGGRHTAELAVRFTVVEKHADPAALGSAPVPPSLTLCGVELPTDVVEGDGTLPLRSTDRLRRS